MTRTSSGALAAAAAVLLMSACNETTTAPSGGALAGAFTSAPTGFSSLTSSFATDGSEGPFSPDHRGPGGPGFGGGPGGGPGFGGGPGGGLMGGGLDGGFVGNMEPGRGFGHGPFGGGPLDGNCTFSASAGTVTCGPDTRDGLTITRIFNFQNGAGTAQEKPDSTTNSIRSRSTVAGTTTRRNGAVAVVDNASDRTVTGIAPSSTQRTVNGTSRGSESTTGTGPDGDFTASRTAGDTTTGVVIPVENGRPTYPTAGTVIRHMKATMTLAGQTPKTSERREVITYNGTATATLVIVHDGVTKNCTLPLPRGRPTCQ